MEHIGFRAHDLGMFDTARDLARCVASHRKGAGIQLALAKVLRNVPSSFSEPYIASIRDGLASEDVHVDVFGCYINPVHPDPDIRNRQLMRFEEHLRYAGTLGCPLVGTETGSAQPDCSFDLRTAEPKTFDLFLHSLERLLKAAERYKAVVGIEPVSRQHTIGTIARAAKVLETFDTPHLAIIYDPVNLTPWTGIPEADGTSRAVPSQQAQRAFFEEALDAFGSKIAAIHVKDYVLDERGWKIGDIPVGTGVLDWKTLSSLLKKRAITVPCLLEDLDPATLDRTIETLSTY